MSPFTAGQRLHDRYVLIEPIGVGGMSRVWRASDEVLGRPVAIKVLSASVATDPALSETTWREARAAGRLTHPHVTRIYDYGQAALSAGDPAPFLVMELVEGQNLAQRLADGPLPWPAAVRVASQVAAALAAAHQVGMVHHDIKPGNVMLTADGAKVLDFGIAALVGAGHQGLLAGTPTYTAPERVAQAPARPENDLYSLGVMLYEMLTGQPPARLATWGQARAHRTGSVPDLPHLPGMPDAVSALVRACLSPEPDARPTARRAATVLARAAGMPDPSSGGDHQPTVLTPGHFAPGSAPLPAPPVSTTRLDHTSGSGTRLDPDATRSGHRPLLLAGGVVGATVLILLLALVLVALRTPSTGPSDSAEAPAAPPTSPASADPAPTPPSRLPDAGNLHLPGPLAGAPEIVQRIERLVEDALAADRITRDTADALLDELADVWDKLTDPDLNPGERLGKVEDEAHDLREEIADLHEDGDLPHDLAAELRNLLEPLLRLPGRG